MKANTKQISACEEIRSQARFWISTNDLSSPTHFCDISECLNGNDLLTESEADELENKLIDLLTFVKSLK